MLLISIPTPCHEDWNKMSPREQGAFCGVCARTVVDFTALSDEEVRNYFLENRGQKTCGRFRNEQLATDTNYLPRLLSTDIPLWKKFLAALFILFGGLLTGCSDNVKGKISAPEQYQTTSITLTDIKSIENTIEPPPPPPPVVEFVVPMVVGDIEVTMGAPVEIVGEPVEVLPIAKLIPDTVSAGAVVDFCLAEADLLIADSIRIKVVKQDSLQGKVPKKDSVKYYLDPE
jgi:hypothetical protein